MSFDILLPILARFLPAIVVFVLGIVAGGDVRTREQWTNLLYQAGILRPAMRSDPKIQSRVRIPFFIVALALCLWPLNYYRYATRVVNISTESDIYKGHGIHKSAAATKAITTTAGPTATPVATLRPPVAPDQAAAPMAPAPQGGSAAKGSGSMPSAPHL